MADTSATGLTFDRQPGTELYVLLLVQPVFALLTLWLWVSFGGPSHWILDFIFGLYAIPAAGLAAYVVLQPNRIVVEARGIRLERRWGTVFVPWENWVPSVHGASFGLVPVRDRGSGRLYQINEKLADAVESHWPVPSALRTGEASPA